MVIELDIYFGDPADEGGSDNVLNYDPNDVDEEDDWEDDWEDDYEYEEDEWNNDNDGFDDEENFEDEDADYNNYQYYTVFVVS